MKVKPKAETIPAATINGLTFWPIPEFDRGESLFMGAPLKAFFDRRNLPDIPQVWEDRAQDFFFRGGRPDFPPQVDATKAIKALRAWLISFEPPHEAKIATVAYALWVWTTPAALVEDKPEPKVVVRHGKKR